MGLVVLLAVLGIFQLVQWLIVKGVIFVMWSLFQINWYGKFWVVYLFILLIGMLFRGLVTINHKEK
jgi:hypothetical protein